MTRGLAQAVEGEAGNGEVASIRAIQSLPFGLTEKAIAAARQIRFHPATYNGRPVNVHMQLEYNFNLYEFTVEMFEGRSISEGRFLCRLVESLCVPAD